MEQEDLRLANGAEARGYVASMGPFNLVFVKTAGGLVACGAFDVVALEKFSFPAVKIRSVDGRPIATVDDLLKGVVKVANAPAQERGVQVDTPAAEAAVMLS